MRYLFVPLVLAGMILCTGTSGVCDSLKDAANSADSAYDYSSRATNPRDVEEGRSRSRQAMSASEEAKNAAIDAKAYDAAAYSSTAYDYSRKAANAKTDQDAQFYSRQAEKAAAEAQSSIDYDIEKKKRAEKNKASGGSRF